MTASSQKARGSPALARVRSYFALGKVPRVPQLPRSGRFAIPFVATALVYFVQAQVLPVGSLAPFVFFYVAVSLSALLGGRVPGLLAVALSAALANYVFVGHHGWAVSGQELNATVLYLIAASVVALLCGAFRDTADRAQQAAEDLRRQAGELAHAEEASRASEARLTLALKASKCGRFEWDARTNVNDWSDELLELYGVRREEPHGSFEEWIAYLVPEDRELALAALRRSLETGLMECEFRIARRDTGELRWMYARGEVFFDAQRQPLRMVGINVDVTERKRAEEELRIEGQRLRAVFENVALGVVEVGPQGRLEGVNQRLCALLGYRPEELLGSTLDELTAPEDRPLSRDLHGRLWRGEVDRFHYEKRYLKNGGEPLWVHVTVSAVRNAAGAVVRAVGTVEDITERRRAEEALRSRERQFRVLIENVYSAVALIDAGGRFALYNARFLELFGLRADSDIKRVNSQDWSAWQVFDEKGHLLHVDDHPVRKVAMTRQPVRNQLVGVRLPAGGDLRWVLISAAPLFGSDGAVEHVICTYHEITDLKRAEEEQQRLLQALREADQQKNGFLAMLSHELRNPLAPIRNSVYILDRAAPGGEQAKRALTVIDRQVSHLARLVDDLLDVTRISRGKIRLQLESLSLNDVVRGASDDFRDLFRRQGTHLDVRVPERPLRARVDRTRVAQVIGNLLSNAAKFTPGGGHVTLALARDDGDRAVIEVCDDGAGIEPRVLGKLFQPFVQADATLDRSKGGLGLGLALVKGLVELHGGSVSVKSQGPGTGSQFTVRLPLEEVEAPAVHPGRPRRGRRAGSAFRVLLIEDNADAAESLKEALELNGHQVETAETGLQGIEKARAFQPDVVLCDIGLPGIDGYEVARRMRGDPVLEAACLVAISGYAAPEDLARSKEAGFARHLAKPPDLETLESTLREACVRQPRLDSMLAEASPPSA